MKNIGLGSADETRELTLSHISVTSRVFTSTFDYLLDLMSSKGEGDSKRNDDGK